MGGALQVVYQILLKKFNDNLILRWYELDFFGSTIERIDNRKDIFCVSLRDGMQLRSQS